ncbi:MAG TPA: ABC transporter permease [Leptolyngbyaceae cyanobacterium]
MTLSFFDLTRLTCKSLLGNPLRSGLTTLGVFMGVAAVNATLQVGTISRKVIEQQLAKREAPQIGVFAPDKLNLDDIKFLQQRLVGVHALSARNYMGWDTQAVFQGQQAKPTMSAVTVDYFRTTGLRKVAGRFFNQADFDNYRPVVVIDKYLVEKLFLGKDPISERVYVDGRPYIVIGVVPTNVIEEEPQGKLLVPMSIYTALTGSRNFNSIQLRPRQLEDMKKLQERVIKLLKQRYPGKDFYDWNNVENILEQKETLEMTSRGLTVVGIISLLIGGVGIANITIAAVMERKSEIGLRLAIGATKWNILMQFILEAVLLSLFGGIIAIIAVHGLTLGVAERFKLPYEFDRNTAIFSLGSAVLVGVGASFVPAWQASQLDPVKALRGS